MSEASVHRSGGPPDLTEMAKEFAKDSIVCRATAQLIEQVLMEVHETRIAPRDRRISQLETALRALALACTRYDEDPGGTLAIADYQSARDQAARTLG